MRSRLVVPSTATTGPTLSVSVADELRRLTPRDLALLDLLGEHRTLTTDQITAVAFTSADRTRKRLVLLYRRRVLDRFRRYAWGGAQPWHWTVGPLSAAVLAARTGAPLSRPAVLRERGDR